jgi:hypothetical protein
MEEIERTRMAMYYLKKLTRKLRPGALIEGDAKIGRLGTVFLNPEKIIP